MRSEQVLNSMCGSGPRTGVRTLADIGDPTPFREPSACRLAIRPQLYHRTITRRQQPLTDAMFITAFVATQHDRAARVYYLDVIGSTPWAAA